MSFGLIQTGFLLGLFALVVPLMIHLIFRQKPRRVALGSVRFLSEIIERERGHRKIMRWLLLALRLLCLTLLSLLFARPFITETAFGTGDRLMVVLIDNSASMQLRAGGRRLVDEAIDQAQQLLRQSGRGAEVEIAFFDDAVIPLAQLRAGESARRVPPPGEQVLEAPPVGFGATDYAAVFRWVSDLCVKATADSKDVHLFTDLQQSGLDWSEAAPMPADVAMHIHDLGRDLPNNVAVTEVQPDRLLARPVDELRVSVSLLNAGPFSLEEVPLVLSLKNGNRPISQRQQVKFEPGSIVTTQFSLPQLAPGLWEGTVSLEVMDDLAFDNQRYLAMMVAPRYRVLLIDGDPHASPYLSETYLVETALRLALETENYEQSAYDPVMHPWDGRLPGLDGYELVVLANVAGVNTDDARRLSRFVAGGGGLIVFTGDQVTPEATSALEQAKLTPGKIGGVGLSSDLPWRIESWDESHSVFQPFNDPQYGDLRRFTFRGYTSVETSGDSQVLARLQTGIPLIIERSSGKGAIIWFLSSCDDAWGDWSRDRLFLPLLHQLLGHVTGLNDGGPVREGTVSSRRPAHGRPGVSQVARHWQVVNVNPRESETDRATVDDFVNRFDLTVEDSANEVRQASVGPQSLDVRENEVWQWIVMLLVGLLAFEFLVANRATA